MLFAKHVDPSWSFTCHFADTLIMQLKIIGSRENCASTYKSAHGLSFSM